MPLKAQVTVLVLPRKVTEAAYKNGAGHNFTIVISLFSLSKNILYKSRKISLVCMSGKDVLLRSNWRSLVLLRLTPEKYSECTESFGSTMASGAMWSEPQTAVAWTNAFRNTCALDSRSVSASQEV